MTVKIDGVEPNIFPDVFLMSHSSAREAFARLLIHLVEGAPVGIEQRRQFLCGTPGAQPLPGLACELDVASFALLS